MLKSYSVAEVLTCFRVNWAVSAMFASILVDLEVQLCSILMVIPCNKLDYFFEHCPLLRFLGII